MAHTFFSLNGWELPARDGTVSQNIITVGDSGRAWSNKPFSNRKQYARQWTVSVECQSAEDANTIEALVYHGGHYFDFSDGLFSRTGIGPDQQTNVTATTTAWGTRSAALFGTGTTPVLLYDLNLKSDSWTFFFAEGTSSASRDAFFVGRSDGYYWDTGTTKTAGSVNAASNFTWTIENGAIAAVGSGAQSLWLQKLLVFPYPLSDAAIVAMINQLDSNDDFSSPYLDLNGSIVNDKEVKVFCDMATQDTLQFGSNNGWVNNGRNLTFTLTENLLPLRRRDIYNADDKAMRFSSTTLPKRPLFSTKLMDGQSFTSAEGNLPDLTIAGNITGTEFVRWHRKSGGVPSTVYTGTPLVLGGNEWASMYAGSHIFTGLAFVKRTVDNFQQEYVFQFVDGASVLFQAYFEEDILTGYARPISAVAPAVNVLGVGGVELTDADDWIAVLVQADFAAQQPTLSVGAAHYKLATASSRRGEIEVLWNQTFASWGGITRVYFANAGQFSLMNSVSGNDPLDGVMAYSAFFKDRLFDRRELALCFEAFMSGNLY